MGSSGLLGMAVLFRLGLGWGRLGSASGLV
jgi:hypothetical protein